MLKQRVLVCVAHPDDEVLGAGGAIARHIDSGEEVRLVTMTDGVSARKLDASHQNQQINIRGRELAESCAVLGIQDFLQLGFPDNKMDSVPLLDIARAIEPIIKTFEPTLIYTNFINDLNIDHVKTAEAVRLASRPLPSTSINSVLMMEVASSTEWTFSKNEVFVPSVFIDIEKQLEKKLRALSCYRSELQEPPHPRNEILALSRATIRGAEVGRSAAEAFVLMRELR